VAADDEEECADFLADEAGLGGGPAIVDPAPKDGGCGCRTASAPAGAGLAPAAILLLAAALRRKRLARFC
jgi:MYXO-CTERM domain-containing protein